VCGANVVVGAGGRVHRVCSRCKRACRRVVMTLVCGIAFDKKGGNLFGRRRRLHTNRAWIMLQGGVALLLLFGIGGC
jgi:hypothetical protein